MKPTWKNTLNDSKFQGALISSFAQIAMDVGYKYMCWNDRIFTVYMDDNEVLWKETRWTKHDMEEPTTSSKIAVACRDSNGSSVIVSYDVRHTAKDYECGAHYELAEDEAMNDGYESPFLCFDETEFKSIIDMGKELSK